MKLYEAIKHGSTLRPESHQERFCNVEGRGLCSDVWGAAVEAVWPKAARLNWNPRDPFKFEDAMNAFRAAQEHYFGRYRLLPCVCPGASQKFLRGRGRVTNLRGDTVIEDGAKEVEEGGITPECQRVRDVYAMADHLFYAHNWTREQVAEVFEWYEETRDATALALSFTHYRSPSSSQRIAQQTLARLRSKHPAWRPLSVN